MPYTETVLPGRVAELLRERSITQQQLGDALGLPQQAIHKSLHGLRRFTVADLCKLAAFFQLTTDELLLADVAEPRKVSHHER